MAMAYSSLPVLAQQLPLQVGGCVWAVPICMVSPQAPPMEGHYVDPSMQGAMAWTAAGDESLQDEIHSTEKKINDLENKITEMTEEVDKGTLIPQEMQEFLHEIQKKFVALDALTEELKEKAEVTTVMVRNIPNDYSRQDLLDLLDEEGFAQKYDFVYKPFDFIRGAGLGYAFVNMISFDEAFKIKHELTSYNKWTRESTKKIEVSWSVPLQGFKANIDRYRNSGMMHPDANDEYRPAVFNRDGVREPFPEPRTRKTKKKA